MERIYNRVTKYTKYTNSWYLKNTMKNKMSFLTTLNTIKLNKLNRFIIILLNIEANINIYLILIFFALEMKNFRKFNNKWLSFL